MEKELIGHIFVVAIYSKKSMNLSHDKPPFLVPLSSASPEHRDVNVVPLCTAVATTTPAAFGHRKKFLDRNASSFSSLPKPVPIHHQN